MAQEILVNINVNSGTAEVKIDKLNRATKDLSKTFVVNSKALASQKGEANLASIEQKRLAYEMQNAGKIAATYSIATNKATKGTKQFRTQVGLNNAILQEAGRAASDLRFGFNGVANNVGQLASLFGALINTSDSVATSLKNLGKSLLGTGGVLIAVQLLIAYADRIYAFFTGISVSAQKTQKAFESLEKSIQGQRRELLGYIEVLSAANIAEETRYNALKELEKVVPDLTKNNNDQKISLEELTLEVEEYIRQQRLRAELDALISNNGEIFAEREKVRRIQSKLDSAETQEEQEEIYKENASFLERIGLIGEQVAIALATPIEKQDGKFDYAKFFKEQNKDLVSEYNTLVGQIIDIEKQLTAPPPIDSPKSEKERFREFEEGLFRIQKTIDKYDKEADKINVRTLEERLELEEDYAKKEADTKLSRFEEVQAKRLEEYKERVADADNANELIRNAELDFQKSIEDARVKHGNALSAIEDGFITKRILAKDKEAQAIGKIERSIENSEIDRLKFSVGANEEYYNAKLEQVSEDTLQTKALIDNAETLKLSDLEVANLRKDLFGLQNKEIDLNLQKEIAAIDAKTAINQEYVGFAKGISQLLGTLAGENEGLQKAALVLEKGAAIADIVIKTQAANAATVAEDTATLGATIPITTPLRLRNNISAGISIANILATTLTSFKKPSGGGGSSGGGAQVQAPDFNVVGASPLDLLMVDVSNKLDKPIPAYITAKGAIETLDEYYRNVRTGSNS